MSYLPIGGCSPIMLPNLVCVTAAASSVCAGAPETFSYMSALQSGGQNIQVPGSSADRDALYRRFIDQGRRVNIYVDAPKCFPVTDETHKGAFQDQVNDIHLRGAHALYPEDPKK